MVDSASVIPKIIVLIGHAGSGKSAVGKKVAGNINYTFFDTDEIIENTIGCSIDAYFRSHGQQQFRRIEAQVIGDLLQSCAVTTMDDTGSSQRHVISGETKPEMNIAAQKGSIISLGGGAWQNADTRQLVSDAALVVWLDVGLEVLWERVSRHIDRRPMLQVPEPKKRLEELLLQRLPFFEMAHVRVALDAQPISQAAEQTLTAIVQHCRASSPTTLL